MTCACIPCDCTYAVYHIITMLCIALQSLCFRGNSRNFVVWFSKQLHVIIRVHSEICESWSLFQEYISEAEGLPGLGDCRNLNISYINNLVMVIIVYRNVNVLIVLS